MPQDSAGQEMKVGMRLDRAAGLAWAGAPRKVGKPRRVKDALIKCTKTGEDCPNSGDVDQRMVLGW